MMSHWGMVSFASEVEAFNNGNIVIICCPDVPMIVPTPQIYSKVSYALLNITHYDFEKQVNINTESKI